jgi:general secretion pathway protein A
MYCPYFGFREKPFNITPNPRFLYLSKQHKEAFAHLLYGIKNHAGFIELTGEVGTGKTTVLRTILGQLEESNCRCALILNPCLSALELLRNINREFAIPHEGLENGPLLDELNRFLLAENRAGTTVVLVIDEAQNLAAQVLEQIRLISNLETESDKLIQIVLAGQPELNELLAKPELRQLAQRITVRYHLLPMDFEDSCAYIKHRIQIAGGGGWINFSAAAMKRIFTFAKGSPRLINKACDRALLIGYTQDTGEISPAIAAAAIKELAGLEVRQGLKTKTLTAAVIILLLVVAALFGAFSLTGKTASQATPPTLLTTAATGGTIGQEPPPAHWAKLPARPYPAMNELFKLWGTTAAAEDSPKQTVASLAAAHGFSVIQLHSLDELLQLDTPAVLEIRLDKDAATRFAAVTSAVKDTFSIMPSNKGKLTVTKNSLAAVWTGKGWIVWKNRLGIPDSLDNSSSAADIRRLQTFLVKEKKLSASASGFFGRATAKALQQLKREAGLTPNGIADERTMLLLNRRHGTPPAPRLQPATGKNS